MLRKRPCQKKFAEIVPQKNECQLVINIKYKFFIQMIVIYIIQYYHIIYIIILPCNNNKMNHWVWRYICMLFKKLDSQIKKKIILALHL